MNLIKKQGGMLLLAVLLIVLIYQFPKSVVENEITKKKVVETTSINSFLSSSVNCLSSFFFNFLKQNIIPYFCLNIY